MLKQPILGDKRCFVAISGIDHHLPIATRHVQRTEVFCVGQSVQIFLNEWQGITVTLRGLIQIARVPDPLLHA